MKTLVKLLFHFLKVKLKLFKLKHIRVILVGPTGAGKGTIGKFLIRWFGMSLSVSDTTRDLRPWETEGVDYHKISKKEFIRRKKAGYYAEWNFHYNAYYGTPKANCDITNGSVLFDVDRNGALALKKLFPGALTIYIKIPGTIEEVIEILRERLLGRQDMPLEQIEKRLTRYPEESQYEHEADMVVINENGGLSACLARVCIAVYTKMGGISVAIDGYSSRGKGTLAKFIANMFGAFFLDSGAVYRYIVYKLAVEKQLRLDDENLKQELIILVDAFTPSELERYKDKLRIPEVDALVSIWSEVGVVRTQAKLIQMGLVYSSLKTMFVADGRDMTTAVFPGATYAFFIDGDVELCAKWRAVENGQPYEAVLANLKSRDEIDTHRDIDPLRYAPELGVVKIYNNGTMEQFQRAALKHLNIVTQTGWLLKLFS